MTRKLQLIYHGTNRETAAIIKKKGFKKHTFFATHLEDAIGFGGPYVFEVKYPSDRIPEEAWQFTISRAMGPEEIVRLKKYHVSTVFEDPTRGTEVLDSNINAAEERLTLELSMLEAEEGEQGEDRI